MTATLRGPTPARGAVRVGAGTSWLMGASSSLRVAADVGGPFHGDVEAVLAIRTRPTLMPGRPIGRRRAGGTAARSRAARSAGGSAGPGGARSAGAARRAGRAASCLGLLAV